MEIKGLDYNTGRRKLLMPEYGREVQQMVDYCKTIADKDERMNCAYAIIDVMKILTPQMRNADNYEQKLWNHLAYISNFELDIDYPCEITPKEELLKHPEPLEYPMQKIKQRHYGHLLELLMGQIREIADEEQRAELIRLTANQMKRSLYIWNQGSYDDERVAFDLAKYTDEEVQLDLDNFEFDRVVESKSRYKKSKNKKR